MGLLLLATMGALTGCEALAVEVETGIHYGQAIQVGRGTIRTYVILEVGRAVEVGVALSDGALEGLPPARGDAPGMEPDRGGEATAGEMGHSHHHTRDDVEYLLDLPVDNPTAYRFVEVNWNPRGHPPEGIYDTPHFDVHFYTISLAEREAIDPHDREFVRRAGRLPAPATVPGGFLPHHLLEGSEPWQATVPRMGMHWIHPGGSEFNGSPFTATLLVGSWDGRFIFTEPMVALEYLRGNPDLTLDYDPAQDGSALETLRVYRDEESAEVRIALLAPRPR